MCFRFCFVVFVWFCGLCVVCEAPLAGCPPTGQVVTTSPTHKVRHRDLQRFTRAVRQHSKASSAFQNCPRACLDLPSLSTGVRGPSDTSQRLPKAVRKTSHWIPRTTTFQRASKDAQTTSRDLPRVSMRLLGEPHRLPPNSIGCACGARLSKGVHARECTCAPRPQPACIVFETTFAFNPPSHSIAASCDRWACARSTRRILLP